MNRFLCALAAALLVATPALARSPAKTRPGNTQTAPVFTYDQSEAAMAFATDLAARRNLDPAWVRQQIGQAQRLPVVVRLMQPAPTGTPKNWAAYRARFIEPVRLGAGQRFWLANRETLARAEAEFGVPASLIVGVIGVETLYGQHTGNYRVIDALSTLAFDFPASHPRAAARTEFFKSELEQFLSLTERTGTDPLTPRGSYAGAMGWPQFMPSSWVKYAIDFDGDGKVDLNNSQADVIGSVANYFKAFGWQTGMPTHYPVRFDERTLDLNSLLAPDRPEASERAPARASRSRPRAATANLPRPRRALPASPTTTWKKWARCSGPATSSTHSAPRSCTSRDSCAARAPSR